MDKLKMLQDDNKKASIKRWLSAIIVIYVLIGGTVEQIWNKPLNMALISLLLTLVTGMIIGTLWDKRNE